jgi:tRNA (mo5U34)-methyltransferase
MIDIDNIYSAFNRTPALSPWLTTLRDEIEQTVTADKHGNLPQWQAILDALPEIKAKHVDFNGAAILIGDRSECDDNTRNLIELQLRLLHPWRKGPFCVFGINIDTEWRSDLKWDRLEHHIADLTGRTVLDVGCGSGYHCWRMAGAGAKLVVGLEPMMLYNTQFLALNKFLVQDTVHLLPFPLEAIPKELNAFDTVFSMGVLYHRRSPFDHLYELRGALRSGGELILETLVVDGGLHTVFIPKGRYAKMRNVWCIPSCESLALWLERAGFKNVRLIDVTTTTPEEQRGTDWMSYESLADFLDPNDASRTVEGDPAPKRAIFIAEAL